MVRATPHPGAALTIYNYTKVAQFTPELWNHVTDLCRGLIVDAERNLVARGFEKFWNLDDARHPETLMANLPTTPPVLTRKMDGSLGIGYALAGKWYVATRGSFDSEQARLGVAVAGGAHGVGVAGGMDAAVRDRVSGEPDRSEVRLRGAGAAGAGEDRDGRRGAVCRAAGSWANETGYP